MDNNLILFGAGGFGKDILWLTTEKGTSSNFNVLGFVDDTPGLVGTKVNDFPVLGTSEWLLAYDTPVNVAICLGNPSARKAVYKNLSQNKNINFPNIISKDILVSKHTILGQGCIITPSCTIVSNINIGDFVIVNLNCTVGHDAILESFVTVSPGSNITGFVKVGEGSDIGSGANIIPKTEVGKNCVIGAGSVVIKDIPDNSTAVGIPAKVIKTIKGM